MCIDHPLRALGKVPIMSPAMFDLACKQLSHVKCVSLPTSEWVRVTLQLCWVLILSSTSLRALLHLMYTQRAGTRIITIRLLLAVLNISESAECQSGPFMQKLVMGASLFSQQDGQCVGNKQPLRAFPNCSAPTWKKNHNKLGVQKWFPVVLNIGMSSRCSTSEFFGVSRQTSWSGNSQHLWISCVLW